MLKTASAESDRPQVEITQDKHPRAPGVGCSIGLTNTDLLMQK